MPAAKKPSMREKAEAAILSYLADRNRVDILNSDFVDYFIDATGCTSQYLAWGAARCPYLSRTLKRMTDEGIFRRNPYGLPSGNWQPGFPKWVYMYRLSPTAVQEPDLTIRSRDA